MKLQIIHIFHVLLLHIIMLPALLNPVQPVRPSKGYWAMEGNLITHFFEDSIDSLSGPELYELQDQNGLPVWFGRHIFKDVCMTGECKMIRLWLFWDGAGNFLGIQMYDNEPLTKSDHSEFEHEDYIKLETILKDTTSVLKDLSSEELIVVPDTINPYKAYEVDGYTAATQPAIASAVVKDAVYTCHTLWHTVYGPVQDAIQEIHENRLSTDYLSLWLNSTELKYNMWAVQMVANFPEYHDAHHQKIASFINSENMDLSMQSLQYFKPVHLQDEHLQNQLAECIPEVTVQQKYEILWKLIALKEVNEETVLKLLHYFQDEKLGVGSLSLICRLISEEHLTNQEIAEIVTVLSKHENNYVRNLTQKLLTQKSDLNHMN